MNSWLWSPSSKGSPTAGCWQCRAAGVERFQRHNAENNPCLGNRALREAAGLGLPQGCVSAKETSFFLVTPQSAHSRSPACFSKLIQTLYRHTYRKMCVCVYTHVYVHSSLQQLWRKREQNSRSAACIHKSSPGGGGGSATAAVPRSLRSLLPSPCSRSFQCWCSFGDV